MSALDPRIDSARVGSGQAGALADLDRRVAALERAATVQVADGAPTSLVRDGVAYGQADGPKLWLRLAGAWRYVDLS